MTAKLPPSRTGRLSVTLLAETGYVLQRTFATLRFYLLGLRRSLHPIPMDRPLPRPTHDFEF